MLKRGGLCDRGQRCSSCMQRSRVPEKWPRLWVGVVCLMGRSHYTSLNVKSPVWMYKPTINRAADSPRTESTRGFWHGALPLSTLSSDGKTYSQWGSINIECLCIHRANTCLWAKIHFWIPLKTKVDFNWLGTFFVCRIKTYLIMSVRSQLGCIHSVSGLLYVKCCLWALQHLSDSKNKVLPLTDDGL